MLIAHVNFTYIPSGRKLQSIPAQFPCIAWGWSSGGVLLTGALVSLVSRSLPRFVQHSKHGSGPGTRLYIISGVQLPHRYVYIGQHEFVPSLVYRTPSIVGKSGVW